MAAALFPKPGDRLHMLKTGASVVPDSRIAEGGQGVVYRAHLEGGGLIALKWYRPSAYSGPMRQALNRLIGYERPHEAFAWPIDLVESSAIESFGYVMPLVPESFRSLISILASSEQPTFRQLCAIGRELVDAFSALHAAGLCYRDINFGNLLVDPVTCEVAIVDNDNIGIDTAAGYVRGTLRFMAPEVLRYEAPPSTVSDLHSLAVFLFYLLVHGHPLEGVRVDQSYNCGDASETQIVVRHFGQDPLFVFDPTNVHNRPVEHDPMWVWWDLYPNFIRDLFIRAFTEGLHDASLAGRVTEGVWRGALVRLADSVQVCSCRANVFWDPADPRKPCWHCSKEPPVPFVLTLLRHSIVLSEGANLVSHHLLRNRDFKTVQARIEAHPYDPGAYVMRNLTTKTWTVHPVGEESKRVEPGQRLAIRPMEIDFGLGVQGQIAKSRPHTPSGS